VVVAWSASLTTGTGLQVDEPLVRVSWPLRVPPVAVPVGSIIDRFHNRSVVNTAPLLVTLTIAWTSGLVEVVPLTEGVFCNLYCCVKPHEGDPEAKGDVTVKVGVYGA
jgi:hypothetical protein